MSYDYLYMNFLNRKMGFEVGSRVQVTRQNGYKSVDLIGAYGTIRSLHGDSISVNLDNIRNPRSSYGAFYFKPGELTIIYENIELNKIMEEYTMQTNITNYLNIAKIRFIDNGFSSSKIYEYANFEPDLKVGDMCVVRSAHHGFGVAKVVEIVEQNDIVTSREIVAKVDTVPYKERVANRNKAAELKIKMQERVKQLQDVALYKMMAESDPIMSEIFKEYQTVIGM